MVLMVLVFGGVKMAYFLKKTKQKDRTYLAIYESFYSPKTKGTVHKSFRACGSIEGNQKKGILDPIAHYQAEVDALNQARQEEGTKQIEAQSPVRHLGYFPLASILKRLKVKPYIDLYKFTTDFQFDLYELLSSLIYARSVHPCSKRKTFHTVLPQLYHPVHYSYNQLLDGLGFLGSNYEKIVELFTAQVSEYYGIDTRTTYFDCTNFYFEIDREDDFRKKGPCKANSKNPIVGLGLLLDQNQLPIGMKLYPGNQSEKPVLRNVIDQLKRQNQITGRTIHVADKGLNCAQNIYTSLKDGDGYLFSKSVKGSSEIEKEWFLLDQDWQSVTDKDGKVLYAYKSCMDDFTYRVEDNGLKKDITITEKRLLTFNPELAKKQQVEIYKMVDKAESLRLSSAKKKAHGESAKYLNFTDKAGKKAEVSINQAAIEKDLLFAGMNLLVTSELKMTDKDMYQTYHNLWRIEESFRVMKSDLDAQPVFVQRKDTIQGHFLICYLTVLLERIFQFKILGDHYATTTIFDFIKDFKAVQTEHHYTNITSYTDFIAELAEYFDLPLTNYFLSETQINSFFNKKLKAITKTK